MEKTLSNVIKEEVIIEQVIQKSKFISYLKPVSTEDEAREYLKEVKKLHPKATHHCSAFRIGDIERSNDDGEPASSAGLPMLQVLRGNNLQNVAAIVVRYYGGILLGVGGLIRAYGSSVTLAVSSSIILKPLKVSKYQCLFPYAHINEVETFISDLGIVTSRDYKENVVYTFETFKDVDNAKFQDITRGSGTIEIIDKYIKYVEET